MRRTCSWYQSSRLQPPQCAAYADRVGGQLLLQLLDLRFLLSALQSCAERWRLRNGLCVGHHAHTALEHVWLPRGTCGAEAVRRLHTWVISPWKLLQWLLQWWSSASTGAVDDRHNRCCC